MKKWLAILTLSITSSAAHSACEIFQNGKHLGSVVNGSILNQFGEIVGERSASIVKSRLSLKNTNHSIAGYSDSILIPVRNDKSYMMAQISNATQVVLGQAVTGQILDRGQHLVGNYSADCSPEDAGAAGLLLIFNFRY